MGRLGVTYEEVELQAETLIAKGENPTIEKIRRALGDRGSNTTLSKYINEWRSQRSQQAKPTVSLSFDIVKEETFKTEYARLAKELKEVNEENLQKQLLIAELKHQIKYQEELLKDLREIQKRNSEDVLEKERTIASIKTELKEYKRLAEDRKIERDNLQIQLQKEKENIGRVEERLNQIRAELELAKLYTETA